MATDFEKKIREGKSSEVLQMIKASHDVTRVIAWPGHPEAKVKMRLLTLSESRLAKVENQQEFNRDGITVAVHNLADYREQEAVHGMWRVFSDADTGEPIFTSAEHMRSFCTNDELSALCEAYNAFADENDPNVDRLSDEDYEKLLDMLKKTPDQIPQKVTNLRTAWKLLRIMVGQQAN